MHSYFSYVNGQDVREDAGQRWLYCIRASAFLRDVLPALSLKRDVERGRREMQDAGTDVVARIALSSEQTLSAALEAAAEAAPAWAAMPLETRMLVGQRFHEEVRRRRHEFVEDVCGVGTFQIERHAFLAAIEHDVVQPTAIEQRWQLTNGIAA